MSEARSRSLWKQFSENSEFRAAMLTNEKQYKLPQQMSIYSNLQQIEKLGIFQKIFNKANGDTIFCFYGMLLLRYKKYEYKVFLTLIKILEEQLATMNGNYSILFFNTLCEGYEAFVSFKNMIKRLPEKFFQKLNNVFIVHPEKSVSLIQWLSFGVVNKFINKITICIKRIEDFSQHQLNPSMLYETLPKEIVSFDKKADKEIEESKLAIKKSVKQAPSKVLSQYELSKVGIPVHLRTLLSYFQTKPEKLKVEGLFRINGSVDDIDTLTKHLSRHNFQILSGIQNPHPVCSLIKNFFTTLKEPIFSYANYQEVIKTDSTLYGDLATSILKTIPILHYKILLLTLGFLVYRVSQEQKHNKMTISNIAVCLYPCFFRSPQYKNQDLLYTSKFIAFLVKIMSDYPKYFSAKMEEGKVYREEAQPCIRELKNMIYRNKKNHASNNLQSKIPSKPNQVNFSNAHQQ